MRTSTRRLSGSPPAAAACAIIALAACGGGTVSDAPLSGTQVLSLAFFQRCVNPIFVTPLQVTIGATTTTKTCAAAACHASATGAGGAFRIIPTAQAVDLTSPQGVIQGSDMYKNFTSAQGETVIGSPTQSLLLNKPLVNGVFHGGGVVFTSNQDPNPQTINFWISKPVPQGVDEFKYDPSPSTCTPPLQ